MGKFLKNFKIGNYNVEVYRSKNSGKKVPRHINRFEYLFTVRDKNKKVLRLDVPSNDIEGAKRGLKGAMRIRGFIKEESNNPSKKSTKKKRKVEVDTSKAHRRSGHYREGTNVKYSKPFRIKTYKRNPRSTDTEIKKRGGTRKEVRKRKSK